MRYPVIAMILLVFLLIASVSSADMEAVQVGFGSLIIGGVFQAGINYYYGDEITNDDRTAVLDRDSNLDFLVNFARLNFKGMIVDDKVRYFVQLDFNPENADQPTLLDAKIGLKYIPYTTLWFGRYAPNFTYFNSLNVARMGLIDYPLMNQNMGIQRQTGIDADIVHKWFDFTIGAGNGLDYTNMLAGVNPEDRTGAGLGNAGWGDENTMKDVYVSGAIKPVTGMRIWGGYWYGRPLDYWEIRDGEKKPHQVQVGLVDAGLGYRARFGLLLLGEFMYNKLKFDNEDPGENERDDAYLQVESMSYYGRLGWNFKELLGVPIEILGQYDWLDPDTKNDKDTHGDNDELTYYTGAVNYYLKDWYAVLSFNYLYKMEKWKLTQKDGTGQQTGLDNDEFKFQVQVAF